MDAPNSLPSLDTLEALEPGHLLRVFPGGWTEEGRNAFGTSVGRVLDETLDRFPINLSALRLIHIADDFPAAVDEWLEHLGRPATGATNEGGFEAHGKTLRWAGADGQPRAVVIISEGVAAGIVNEHPLSRGLLAHELGHVFEAAAWPAQPPPADVFKLDELSQWVAEVTISEFLAETIGASFVGEEWRANNVQSSAEWLVLQTTEVEAHVARYFETTDVATTWGEAASRLGQVFIHFGRTAAAALHHDPEDDVDRESPLLGRIERDRPGWRGLIEALFGALNQLDGDPASWLARGAGDVAAIYRDSWAIEGLKPYYRQSGEFRLVVASPRVYPRGTRAAALASAPADPLERR